MFGRVWSGDRMLLGDRVRWGAVEVVRSSDESSLLVAVQRDRRTTLLGRGEPEGVIELVAEWVWRRGAAGLPMAVGWMSVPRGAVVPEHLLATAGLTRFSTWDWLVADVAPPYTDAEAGIERLDPVAEADAIRACLTQANPGTTAVPDGPDEAAWIGVRDDDGQLVGVFGAALRGGWTAESFSWHLHGLGVLPPTRGRGLGAALTANLTRLGLDEGADWVSLGMYADNEPARHIYHRLGYVTEAEFDSYGPVGSQRPPT